MFYDKYIVCTDKNSNLLSDILSDKKPISASNDFQRWSAQVPQNSYIKVFFVLKEIEKFMPRQFAELGESLKSGGLIVQENKNSFTSSAFFIKKKKSEDLTKQKTEKYLAQFTPQNTEFFLNGKNSASTINLALEELRYKEFLLGKMRAFIQDEFFADVISLEDDIFPLFAKDFLLAIIKQDDGFYPLLVVNTDDAIFANAKKEKFIKGFSKMSSKYGVKILENENGISEVFPKNGILEKNTENFMNTEINYLRLNVDENKREFAIAQDKKLLIFAEQPKYIKEFIENINTENKNIIHAEIVEKFPFKTFSYYDEILAFSGDFLSFLGDNVREKFYFIDQVSVKLVRIPDSFRLDVEIKF